MNSPDTSSQLSLFQLLSDELGDVLPVVTYTKATLVHLSHTLEDIVLREKLPALMFTGFQKSSHWRKETERYRELAGVAQQVAVFAGEPLPPESLASQLHITLRGDDPLRQEWFLAILSPRFAVILAGQDNLAPVDNEGLREFDTFWSFEPHVVERVLNLLEHVVAAYRPERLPQLQEARREMPPQMPDAGLITRFTLDMLRFEEALTGKLRREQEQFQQVAAAISHQIVVLRLDLEGGIHPIFISPNIQRLTGYPASHFESDWERWRDLLVGEDRRIALDHFQRLQDGDDSMADYRIRERGGQEIWVRDNAHVRYDPVSGDKLVYRVLYDITAQRDAETAMREREMLQLALEKERELSRDRMRFMTTVSHEFRTPLATILSAAENLERYRDRMAEDAINGRLKTIQGEVLHLRRMLDDIATIVAGESGRLAFAPAQTDLRWLAGDVVEGITVASKNSHLLQLDYEGESSPVYADPRLIRHILSNLLSNAVKYSEVGSTVTLDVVRSERQVVIRVTDSGIGIPPEEQSHIFEPFFRASNAENLGGTGLGLKIVYDCVVLHGGSVRFTSVPGRGTTFVVTLPISATP